MSSENKIFFITDTNFEKLLDSLCQERKVYIPQAAENREGGSFNPYELRTSGQAFTYYGFRPSQPLKTFLFDGRMKVAEYPSTESNDASFSKEPVVIVGAAACDIESLKSLDAVFLQDTFTDIFYRERRDSTLIITADCTEPRETCFCTLAGHCPYPTEGFDLNLTRMENGFIIETGSEKGITVKEQNASLFSDAGDDLLRIRNDSRSEITRKVEELNKEYTLSQSRRDLLEIQRESDEWYEHVRTCIECGACLFSCPTCHCFLLYDQKGSSDKFERIKEWDVCVYAGFSKMAGGGSPRLGLMERFRHRYLHKFEYFPKNFEIEACTGCGRCIEGCMGKIDMRKVFKALDKISVGAK